MKTGKGNEKKKGRVEKKINDRQKIGYSEWKTPSPYSII